MLLLQRMINNKMKKIIKKKTITKNKKIKTNKTTN